MEELGVKHLGLFLFGIILLVIGLVASFYPNPSYPIYSASEYPYQSIGILLDVAGIILILLGFLYSPPKTPPPSNPSQSVS
jgi:uncharacterized membrane protein HdeD (DUF308 family)